MARLTTTVFVVDPDGRDRPFGPGEDLPDWAAEQITNPDVWDGDLPAHLQEGSQEPGEQKPPEKDAQVGEEPPRSGKGSSVAAWKAYAASRGVTVEEDATRERIIDLIAERGLIEG